MNIYKLRLAFFATIIMFIGLCGNAIAQDRETIYFQGFEGNTENNWSYKFEPHEDSKSMGYNYWGIVDKKLFDNSDNKYLGSRGLPKGKGELSFDSIDVSDYKNVKISFDVAGSGSFKYEISNNGETQVNQDTIEDENIKPIVITLDDTAGKIKLKVYEIIGTKRTVGNKAIGFDNFKVSGVKKQNPNITKSKATADPVAQGKTAGRAGPADDTIHSNDSNMSGTSQISTSLKEFNKDEINGNIKRNKYIGKDITGAKFIFSSNIIKLKNEDVDYKILVLPDLNNNYTTEGFVISPTKTVIDEKDSYEPIQIPIRIQVTQDGYKTEEFNVNSYFTNISILTNDTPKYHPYEIVVFKGDRIKLMYSNGDITHTINNFSENLEISLREKGAYDLKKNKFIKDLKYNDWVTIDTKESSHKQYFLGDSKKQKRKNIAYKITVIDTAYWISLCSEPLTNPDTLIEIPQNGKTHTVFLDPILKKILEASDEKGYVTSVTNFNEGFFARSNDKYSLTIKNIDSVIPGDTITNKISVSMFLKADHDEKELESQIQTIKILYLEKETPVVTPDAPLISFLKNYGLIIILTLIFVVLGYFILNYIGKRQKSKRKQKTISKIPPPGQPPGEQVEGKHEKDIYRTPPDTDGTIAELKRTIKGYENSISTQTARIEKLEEENKRLEGEVPRLQLLEATVTSLNTELRSKANELSITRNNLSELQSRNMYPEHITQFMVGLSNIYKFVKHTEETMSKNSMFYPLIQGTLEGQNQKIAPSGIFDFVRKDDFIMNLFNCRSENDIKSISKDNFFNKIAVSYFNTGISNIARLYVYSRCDSYNYNVKRKLENDRVNTLELSKAFSEFANMVKEVYGVKLVYPELLSQYNDSDYAKTNSNFLMKEMSSEIIELDNNLIYDFIKIGFEGKLTGSIKPMVVVKVS